MSPSARGEAGLARAGTLALVGAIFLVALGLRGAAAAPADHLLSRDGVRYAKMARQAAEGDLRGLLANDYPPGYPLAAAGVASALGARSDLDHARACVLASVLAGALTTIPAFLLGRRAAGRAGGAFAALAVAVLPSHVAISADALTEPFMGLCALLALTAGVMAVGARSAALSALSGASGAIAFLARPEGLLGALAPLLARGGWGRRAASVLGCLTLLAAPYVLHASRTEGRLALSRKKGLDYLAARAAEPLTVLGNAARSAGRGLEGGQAVAIVALAGLVLGLRRARPLTAVPAPPPGPEAQVPPTSLPAQPALRPREASIILGGAAALELLVSGLVRDDPRFGLIAALYVTPLAGIALVAAAEAVAARREHGTPLRTQLFLGAMLLAASIPGIAHQARPVKGHLRACAAAIRADARARGNESPRVAAHDGRLALLAGDESAQPAKDNWPRPVALWQDADYVVLDESEERPADLTPARAEEVGRFLPASGVRARGLILLRVRR